MIIVRTCGSGTDYNDDRLQLLKKMLEFPKYEEYYKKIFKLHDHKGTLSVYWYETPTEQEKSHLTNAWEYLREYNIEHFVITITEKQI
jgi:hypothetical protein